MSFNESIVEAAALEWFLFAPFGKLRVLDETSADKSESWAIQCSTNSSSRSVNHRRSGLLNVPAGKLPDPPDSSSRSSPKP